MIWPEHGSFGALVHRSIVSRRRAVGVDLEGGVVGRGDGMQVDESEAGGEGNTRRDGERERELVDQEELLVERLWKKLVEHGFLPVSFEDGSGWRGVFVSIRLGAIEQPIKRQSEVLASCVGSGHPSGQNTSLFTTSHSTFLVPKP